MWHISRRDTKTDSFQRMLLHTCSSHGKLRPLSLTTHSLAGCYDPSSCPMKEVVNFLTYTYTKGLSSSSSPSLLTIVKAYEDHTAPTQEKKYRLYCESVKIRDLESRGPLVASERTIGRICQSAGIAGYKTNHSLRATSATRLYQSGVDEQLVMERTGHRSLDGVRSYKRTSDSQREALSDILNRQGATSTSTHKSAVTLQSSQHSQLLQGLSLPSATFSHCTVTFNIGCAASGSGEANQKPPRKRRAVIFDDSDSD